jgi:tetratricopeptide (TPR) repeat protein
MGRLIAGLLVAACMAFASTASAAEGKWLRAEGQRFIVFADRSEAEARAAVRKLETFDALLRRITGVSATAPTTKLEIYLLRDRNLLSRVRPRIGSGVGGFYSATPDHVGAFVDYSGRPRVGELDGQDVLFHEYAHHFMLQQSEATYPKWYVEGFAEYVSTVEITPERIELGRASQTRTQWLASLRLMPTRELILAGRENRNVRGGAGLFYAQSWFVTHYLSTNPERGRGLTAYLRAMNNGGDPLASFEPSFGISMKAFDDELDRYSRRPLPGKAYSVPPQLDDAQIAVTRLPESMDDFLLTYARLRQGFIEEDDHAALLAQVKREAGRRPNDVHAQHVLAWAEFRSGSKEEALRLVNARLGATPDDVDALYLRGACLVELARENDGRRMELLDEARISLARANRLAPDQYATLYRYWQSFAGLTAANPENVLNILLLSQQLAPQVEEIRLNAAAALMHVRAFDEAITILLPLANTPHGGKDARQAQAMIDAARKGEPPPPMDEKHEEED